MPRQRKLQTQSDVQKRLAETTIVSSKSKSIQKSPKVTSKRKTQASSSNKKPISSVNMLKFSETQDSMKTSPVKSLLSPRNIIEKNKVQQYFKSEQKPAFRVCTTSTGSKGKSPQSKKDPTTRSENTLRHTMAQTTVPANEGESLKSYKPSKRALKLVHIAQPNNI
jgi:hypothetical protein